MPHAVSNQPWGTVDIVLHEGRIFFQQNWLYDWQVQPPMAFWTQKEKQNLHNTMDQQIWATWSNRIRIPVRATPTAMPAGRDFVIRCGGQASINFDIHWVTRPPGHWRIMAMKTRPGDTHRSNVDFANWRIEFYSHDLPADDACNEATPAVCTNNFQTAPHEFGHTINANDEYEAGNAYLNDTNSIMNIGRQVRPRHLQLIVNTLNTMLRGCVFSLPRV